jgi:hypothetical protein
LVAADMGRTIRVRETATSAYGHTAITSGRHGGGEGFSLP